MRRSTRLFISVLSFAVNFSSIILGLLVRNPGVVALSLVFLFVGYQGIHDVMALLDANETKIGEENEEG